MIFKNYVYFSMKPSYLLVRAGSTLLDQGGQVREVTSIILHELFDKITKDYDIAVLRLKENVDISKSTQFLNLPIQDSRVPDGTYGSVSGWGRLSQDGPVPVQLQEVKLPTLNDYQCQLIYSGLADITSRMFCAGVLEGGKDTCQVSF